MGAYAPHARLIADRIRRTNPIVSAPILADLGTVDGTPVVLARVGDAARRVVYTLPSAIRVGREVFVAREGAALTAPLTTVTSNYQVIGIDSWGSSAPGRTDTVWGAGGGTWGAD